MVSAQSGTSNVPTQPPPLSFTCCLPHWSPQNPPPKKKPQRECHSASGRAYVKNYPAGAQTQTPVYPFTTRTHYSKRDPNPLPAHSGGMRLRKKRQGLSGGGEGGDARHTSSCVKTKTLTVNVMEGLVPQCGPRVRTSFQSGR